MIYQNVPRDLLKDLPQPNTAVDKGDGLCDVYTHKHHEAMQPVAFKEEPVERKQFNRNRD